jgi:hypothetical protein
LEQVVFFSNPIQEYCHLPQFIEKKIGHSFILQSKAPFCLCATIKTIQIIEIQNIITFPILVYFFVAGFRQNHGNFLCLIPLKAVFLIYILLLVEFVINLSSILCYFGEQSRFKRRRAHQ